MAEEGKKISFGFSKSIKKPALKNVPPPEQKKVDYIECLDEKAIKIVGGEEKKDEPLIIPMLGSKTWHDRIINKVDADIFEPKPTEPSDDKQVNDQPAANVQIKQEPEDNAVPNGDVPKQNNVQPMEVTEIKNEPGTEVPLSLEEQAAREIIADLKSEENGKAKPVFTVPVKTDNEEDLRGKEESTLEDYESIPIEAFGEAMLRGMGWQPGKGIGKNETVVAPVIPELRPKGMGLGADKRTIQKALQRYNTQDGKQELKLVKGSYVKITEGKNSGSYGVIEAFDDDVARIFVKLALGNSVICVNEYWVQPVTSSEFMEKSKVLNLKSYQEYKDNEAKKEKEQMKKKKPKREPSHSSSLSNDEEDERSRRREKSSKKSKKKRRQSSDDDSSPDRKSRRKRSSSSSTDEDQKYKKSKKSKKHKSRDSSSERSSRKNRKKDKEREKSRQKKSDYSDSSERVRHKDRKRSRSRSRSRTPKSRRRNRSRSRSSRR